MRRLTLAIKVILGLFFICLGNTYLSRWHEYSNPRWLDFFFFPSRIALWLKKFHNNYSICLFFILRPCFFSYNFLIWINYFNLKIIFSSSSFNFFHLSNLIFILIVIWINHKKKDQTWLSFFYYYFSTFTIWFIRIKLFNLF
jgi:hypothetical protein